MTVNYGIECDECRGIIENTDECYCKSCVEDLKKQVDTLEKGKDQLLDTISALEEKIDNEH